MTYYHEVIVWQAFIGGLVLGVMAKALYIRITAVFSSRKKPARSLATQRASQSKYSVGSKLRPSA